MNRIQKTVLATFVVAFLNISVASAQIYVNVRPIKPVVVRIEAPTPRHVWIDEDWMERDGHYVWSGGHWEAPPHNGYRYTKGYWRHSGHGHAWHAGRWHH